MRSLKLVGLACLLVLPAWAAPPKAPETATATTKKDPKLTPAERRAWRKSLNAAREAQKAGKLPQALEHFDAAIDLYPENPRALGERGWALYKMNEMKRAEADIRAALKRTGNPELKGSQLYNLGRIQEATTRIDGAIESYRSSLAVRPHPVVQKRLEALTKTAANPLEIKAAVAIDKVSKLCPKEQNSPFSEVTCTAASVGTLGGFALETFTVLAGPGEKTTNLVFKAADGRLFVTEGVYFEYNPGAFGIMEETRALRFSVEDGTLRMYALKDRRDSDMGLNEIEFEETETRMYCGVVKGRPHCTNTLTTAYQGRREVLHEEDDEPGADHDLWSMKWALSTALNGRVLDIGNAGPALPPGVKALLGRHTLPW